MTYSPSQVGGNAGNDAIIQDALYIAQGGCDDIDKILKDIKDDSDIDLNGIGISDGTASTAETSANSSCTTVAKYGITGTSDLKIDTAAGAMIVDDLMQKITTKVQVAAQLLSTANNINKTVSRIMSQG